jgi:glycosyltransferase involved in cell wall biosynthesis
MAPRSVLYVHSSAGRYGADNQLLHIARGLDPARYRALVVLPFEGELADALRDAGVEVVIQPLAVLRRADINPAGLARIARAARADRVVLGGLTRDRDIELVHSNTSVVLGGRAAAHAAGVPHVWHVREIYDGFRAWPAWRRVLLGADAVACVSVGAARQFAPNGMENVQVVHDAAAPPAGPGDADVRSETGVSGAAFAVAMLGRLSEWKGQDVLIRALAQSPLADFDVVALIAGAAWPGEERIESGLHGLARDLGVMDRVRFLGERSDVRSVYAAADAVAVPSTRPDPFPNTALEAGLAGLPVVAASHGGLPEIVRNRETGLLVTPGDPHALAQALALLAADPELAARMGAAGAAEVAERFSVQRLADRLQKLYDHLLAARPARQ